MVIKYLKRNEFSRYFFVALVALLLWLSGFVAKPPVELYGNMPLYELLVCPLLTISVIPILIAFGLLLVAAFLLNDIAIENELISEPSFLTALMYVVFMSSHISLLSLHPALIANVFLLLSLRSLTNSYRKQDAFSNVFDSGAFFAIAALFYSPTPYILPVFAVGLFLMRPFNWREWVIFILGMVVPFLFILTYYYWNDQLLELINDKLFRRVKDINPTSYFSSFYVIISLVILLLIFAIKNILVHFIGATQRKIISTFLFFGLFLFGLLSMLSASFSSVRYYAFLMIPLSVFTAEYFLQEKNLRWANFIFYLLLISIVVNLMSSFI